MFNFSDHLQELRSTVIGVVLILAATVIGFVWISVGMYFWLSSVLGTIWGPVVLGLIYFLPIIIFAMVKAFHPPAPVTPPRYDTADLAATNLTKIIENLSGRSPLWVASTAVLAGFLATRFPALLSVFMQLLSVYADDVKTRATAATADFSTSAEKDPGLHQ